MEGGEGGGRRGGGQHNKNNAHAKGAEQLNFHGLLLPTGGRRDMIGTRAV